MRTASPMVLALFRHSWWRHQIEIFSALLAICAGNSPVAGEFPAQRPVTRSFDVFFDLRLNKRVSKQSWGWYLRRHRTNYDVAVMLPKLVLICSLSNPQNRLSAWNQNIQELSENASENKVCRRHFAWMCLTNTETEMTFWRNFRH